MRHEEIRSGWGPVFRCSFGGTIDGDRTGTREYVPVGVTYASALSFRARLSHALPTTLCSYTEPRCLSIKFVDDPEDPAMNAANASAAFSNEAREAPARASTASQEIRL